MGASVSFITTNPGCTSFAPIFLLMSTDQTACRPCVGVFFFECVCSFVSSHPRRTQPNRGTPKHDNALPHKRSAALHYHRDNNPNNHHYHRDDNPNYHCYHADTNPDNHRYPDTNTVLNHHRDAIFHACSQLIRTRR